MNIASNLKPSGSPSITPISGYGRNLRSIHGISNTKTVIHKTLDKRIHIAFTHCANDKSSKICKIIWDGVEECLYDINVVNQYHKWNLVMEEEP